MKYPIVENFNIQGEARVQEFREFLSSNMHNSSLRAPIGSVDSNQSYAVSLRASLTDVLTLESLFKKWSDQDMKAIPRQPQMRFKSWVKSLFVINRDQ